MRRRSARRRSSSRCRMRQASSGRRNGDTDLARTKVNKPLRKLSDDAAGPACIINKRGIGNRMAGPTTREWLH